MDSFGHPRKKTRAEAFLSENGGAFNSHESGSIYGEATRFKLGISFASPSEDLKWRSQCSSTEKESLPTGLGSKSKACTKFFSTSGCPYGDGCHYLHHVPGGINSVTQMANLESALSGALRKPKGVLPKDQTIPPANFKTRLCSNYGTADGCRFGDKCHFAHGEKELGKGNAYDFKNEWMVGSLGSGLTQGGLDGRSGGRLGYRELTPPGIAAAATFGAASTVKISIDASLAGVIIGKGGVNSKQISRVTGAKLAIKDHESETGLKNIELEGTFDQIKQASAMVRELIMHTKTVVPPKQSSLVTNNYKTKLCENYAQGTCTFGDRCHFAHGANELRDNSIHA